MKRPTPNPFLFELLERRILLSADALPLPADIIEADELVTSQQVSVSPENSSIIEASPAPLPTPINLPESTEENRPAAQSTATDTSDDPTTAKLLTTESQRQEIFFINDNIDSSTQFLESLSLTEEPNTSRQVIVLDSTDNGISQITETLKDYNDVSAVHLFTHGAKGTVQLGSTWLNNDNINGYQDAISSWSDALNDQADILFFGCNLAENSDGKTLLATISSLTEADVAASNDPTGHQTLGGDWLLEYTKGEIESTIPLSQELQEDWLNLLVEETISDDFASGDYTGSTGSFEWAGDWVEIGDNGNAIGGNVYGDNGGLSIDTAKANQSLRGISRNVNISTASTVYLSYDYSTTKDDGGGYVKLQIQKNGVPTWDPPLKSYDINSSSNGSEFIDISSYISNDTTIRFISEGKNDGGNSDGTDTFSFDNIQFKFATSPLWFSTIEHVSGGGQPGLDTWRNGDILQLADPNLTFEDGIDPTNVISNGTVALASDMNTFINDDNINALHYVSTDIQVGASNYQLYAGDLLLSSIDAADYDGLSVDIGDVVVYHPDNLGNYSSGTFEILLKDLSNDGSNIRAITLIEKDTAVGDVDLEAGDFLFVEGGDPHKNHIHHFDTIDVGATSTSGTESTLFDGNRANINLEYIMGMDLVETSTTIGGRTLNSGEILLSMNTDGTAGNNALAFSENDIISISVASGTGDFTASDFLEGTEMGFSGNDERFDAFSLTVSNNAPPSATNLNSGETYTEEIALDLTNIVISDTDSTDLTASLTLSDTTAGTLSTATSGATTSTFASGVWTASGAIGDVNTLLAGVVFTPATNYDSDFTIDVDINDGTSLIKGTKIMTAISVNSAPTATNLSAAESYTEDTPLNLVNIVITDVDSTNVTAKLTLSDTGAGSLNTATSGSVTSTFAGGTWTASGALADVNILLSGVTFSPTPDYNADFSINTSVDDGVNPALTGTKNITGTAVNDAPLATNLETAQNYTEDTPLALTDIVITDVDNSTITATLTLSDSGAGSFNTATSGAVTSTYNSGTGEWVASGDVSDVNTLLAGLTFTPTPDYNSSFTIATSIDDGVALPVTGVKNITGIAADDAPTATNLNVGETYTENVALNLVDIVITEVDGEDVTATLTLRDPLAGSLNTDTSASVTSTYTGATGVWEASGNLADVNTLLAGLTFTPSVSYSSDFDIDISIDDGAGAPITGTKNMTAIGVNTAPSATNLSAAEGYTEDTALNLIDIVITDIDSPNVTATLTLTDTAAGTLSTTTAGTVTSTYDSGTGVWTASGALANVNTLLAGVTFTPTLDFNSDFTIATSVDDGFNPAVTGDKAITGTSVNDAPTATNMSTAESYTEDTVFNLTDIVIVDVDSSNVSVSLSLSNLLAGTLSTSTSGAVTSTFNAGTGVWAASGAVADVNNLLGATVFTPSLNFDKSFSIHTSVNDGIAADITGSKNMIVTPVDDAPTATNLNAAESYTEDSALNLTDIVISDVDSANVTATLTLSDVASGTLSTATSGGVTSTFDAGVWSATGALTDVNTLLAGITFTPTLNYNSEFHIGTSVDDGVNTALAGTKKITGNPIIPAGLPLTTVASVPTISAPASSAAPAEETEEEASENGPILSAEERKEEVNESKVLYAAKVTAPAVFTFDLELKQLAQSLMEIPELVEQELSNNFNTLEEQGFTLRPAFNKVADIFYKKRSVIEFELLKNSLDSLKDETTRESRIEKTVIGSAIAASTGLSAGYVIWLIRSGVLLSSLLSTMPAWQLADPLAILVGRGKESSAEADDSLAGIIKQERKKQHSVKKHKV